MRKFLLLFFLVPILGYAQSGEFKRKYIFLATGFDVRNAISGKVLRAPAYDGTYTLGYRNENFQVQANYEYFSKIYYQDMGLSAGMIFRIKHKLNYGILAGIVLIQREVKWIADRINYGFSLTPQAIYHFTNHLFMAATLDGKYRGDIEETVVSGRLALGFKI
ncbi:MAG: hypothetical protein WBV11_06755 [Salegentibacter sp.]